MMTRSLWEAFAVSFLLRKPEKTKYFTDFQCKPFRSTQAAKEYLFWLAADVAKGNRKMP
jgi:hypothetical protein